MSDILERLDKLKAQMQDEDFQKGNGLSNEVNIHIFCYDPKDEMAVRYFTEQLVSDQDINCHVIEKNLYKIFLKLCEDKRLLDKIPNIEATKGTEFLLKNLQGKAASAKNFVDEICKDGFKEGDVLLITGVGEAYPFIRSHNILNTIQPQDLNSIPIVVLYPGSFDGRDVYLFNKLPKQDYYRAFNAIVEGKR
ncbi:DUF1788 domain-containing protein [Butyrivibrio sp. AE2015]|uniref:DUF1788 domain-containing protein n=1 Tax=Butyrivibrio sp. AE2015 TaxID=1280663 RepID=UPI0003B5ECB4|nr:DUF1788 domain-containing protein [Butyrivibrio sp. AE2015]